MRIEPRENNSNIKPEPERALHFLKMYFHRERYAISAIYDGQAPITRSLKLDEVPSFILKHNEAGANIYFQPAETHRPLNKKAKKEDIYAVLGAHVDIDGDAGESWELLLERLNTADVPKPSLIWKTGSGGIQAMWMFDQKMMIDSEADTARIEQLGKRLASGLGGDHTHNIDRILRLPGTVNYPNAKKQAKGRTVALSKVIWPEEGAHNG